MAKDIFLGALGVVFGIVLVATIGSWLDPDHKYDALWNGALVLFIAIGGFSMIWLGLAILGE